MADAIQASIASRVTFLNHERLPAVLTAEPGETIHSLLEHSSEELTAIRLQYGALLFRGFGLATAQDFHAAADLLFDRQLRGYIGGVSPRGEVMSGVYESTRFPAHIRLPQHNEMSYLPDPPREIAFFCEVEPRHGGETPLSDSRRVYDLLPEATRSVFESSGISYHRYLYGPRWNIHHRTRNRLLKLYTSWMQAFSTNNPAVVERACAESGGSVEWDREQGAKINHVLPAVRNHPETGERLWFNQVSTFLSSPRSIGWVRWLLYQMAYPNPLRRPFHATLGDGRPITLAQLDSVNRAIDAATVKFPWRRGDLLLLDNFLVAHGRMPFRGERRILVAMR
jgi:alpha-ketoglutarate-dependent taurine dioxygenase